MIQDNRYFISLINRELKRLHQYLYYNLPWKDSAGNEESKKWAMTRIEKLHAAMQPVIFIPKDSGIDDIKF